MTREELMLRQLRGQHLTAPAGMPAAARDCLGFQAQFLSNALHALRLRSTDFDPARARALLVKSWTVRGTMHVFAKEDLPLFLHADRAPVLRPQDTLEGDGRITGERKAYFAELIVRAVDEGVAEREALKAACFAAGMTETEGESVFDPWGGTLRALCENGTLCHVVGEKKAFQRCPPFVPMERAAAELELARRYFTRFGPATLRDAAYFFGRPQKTVKGWLDALPAETAACGGKTYFYVEDGGTPETPKLPDCLFLAGFDQLLMGYRKEESLYLPPEYLRGIFNKAGIVFPALLLRGRVAGRWKREGARLRITQFASLRPADRKRVARAAAVLWDGAAKPEFIET